MGFLRFLQITLCFCFPPDVLQACDGRMSRRRNIAKGSPPRILREIMHIRNVLRDLRRRALLRCTDVLIVIVLGCDRLRDLLFRQPHGLFLIVCRRDRLCLLLCCILRCRSLGAHVFLLVMLVCDGGSKRHLVHAVRGLGRK